MIKDLKLHPLPARRKLIRLSTFHTIKHGIIDLKLEDHNLSTQPKHQEEWQLEAITLITIL